MDTVNGRGQGRCQYLRSLLRVREQAKDARNRQRVLRQIRSSCPYQAVVTV
jgi:hypothetical protein